MARGKTKCAISREEAQRPDLLSRVGEIKTGDFHHVSRGSGGEKPSGGRNRRVE